ncbi:zinc finger protein 681-like isoform X2 [Galleria mellonella]|uniref:Zinc finger protein 681-like isoform X2 n=1 Tax=Galleria mellonella TaxID=7137 RepID=A0A6J1X9C5_GALME|nr:zinc finger protein 681-like isoform X2 [Galleria mellonella]
MDVNILRQQFVKFDIIFHQACDICTHLIIKIYLVMRKHNEKLEQYNVIIDKLIYQVEKKSYHLKDTDKVNEIYLNVQEPNNDYKESVNNQIVTEDKIDFETALKSCKKCDMKFKSTELLQKHYSAAHRNISKSMICDICGKNYKSPQALKDHLNSHTEKQCPYCCKSFKVSYYNEHVRNHESKERRKRNKLYYNCSHCSYKSVNKCSLNAHINKIHLQIRPFVCKICFKGFHKKSTLTEHIRIHEKRKDLTCELCGEGYVCIKTLTEHLRLHSGEKPYQCEICNVKFASSGRRTEHIKRKHREKTESCLICNKMFSLKKEVKRHMKIVHKNVVGTESQLSHADPQSYVFNNIDVIL